MLVDKLRTDSGLRIHLTTSSCQPIPMLTGLELGAEQAQDPQRPSLILQRLDKGSLWELAKACGSTVDAIRRANCLTEDPDPEKMLLIPIL